MFSEFKDKLDVIIYQDDDHIDNITIDQMKKKIMSASVSQVSKPIQSKRTAHGISPSNAIIDDGDSTQRAPILVPNQSNMF